VELSPKKCLNPLEKNQAMGVSQGSGVPPVWVGTRMMLAHRAMGVSQGSGVPPPYEVETASVTLGQWVSLRAVVFPPDRYHFPLQNQQIAQGDEENWQGAARYLLQTIISSKNASLYHAAGGPCLRYAAVPACSLQGNMRILPLSLPLQFAEILLSSTSIRVIE
jgi:hypothetical protein